MGNLKKKNCVNANGIQSIFVLTNLEKFNETRLKLSQGGVPVLWQMKNYDEARVQLTANQLKKLEKLRNQLRKTLKVMNFHMNFY